MIEKSVPVHRLVTILVWTNLLLRTGKANSHSRQSSEDKCNGLVAVETLNIFGSSIVSFHWRFYFIMGPKTKFRVRITLAMQQCKIT